MKRWPFSRKACLLAALIMAAVLFPAVSQSIFDEDFDTYIEYNSALLSEYMDANGPYLDEFVEKSGRNVDEFIEATGPFIDRLINDPHYTHEDYRADTKEYYDKMRRKSSEYSKQYNSCSRPLRNAYRNASADTDGSGDLIFYELEQFQRRLVKIYSYILNSTALLSEEFLAQDGGDCEDWSIVTAGLLQFWDVPAYVGTLGA